MAVLPANLPTNWTTSQIVTPNGTEAGLTEQHGYNYLNKQINAAQTEVNSLNSIIDGLTLHSNINIYVSTTGSDTTGDGTQNKPFATIQKAVAFIPKNLNGYDATINISGGTFNVANLRVSGFFGGMPIFTGVANQTIFNVSGTRVDFLRSQAITVGNIIFDGGGTKSGYIYAMDTTIRFNSCTFRNLNNGINAFQGARLTVYASVFNNNSQAVRVTLGSNATISECSGTGNDIVYVAIGTIINASTQSPSGTTMISESDGGRVFRGN